MNVEIEKNDKCIKCDKVFSSKTNLKHHIKRVHEITENGHECHVCKMKFKTEDYLMKHNKIHEGLALSFKCKECDKTFPNYHNSFKHYNSVHLKKTYKCEHCNKELSDESYLKLHIQSVHEKSKEFKCQD